MSQASGSVPTDNQNVNLFDVSQFKLLPCPFAHDPEDGELLPEIIDDGDGWHIECPCGIRGRTSMRMRSVVDEWNARAPVASEEERAK